MSSSSCTHSNKMPASGSWASVIAVSVGAFVLVSSECAPIAMLPKMALGLQITEGQAGLLITFPGIMAALAAPASIALLGNNDRRTVLCGLLLALTLSNLVVALSSNWLAILGARALLGISLGGFWTIATSVGSRLRPSRQSLRATAIIYSGISMGTVAGVPASTLLGDWLGWRLTFGIWGVIGFSALIGLACTLPSLPSLPRIGMRNAPELLRLPKMRVGLAAIALMLVGHFSAYTFVTPFLQRSFDVTGSLLSVFLLTYGVAGFAGNWLGGWYANRSLTGAILIAATGMAFSLTTLMISDSSLLAWLSLAGWGIFFGALPITTQLYVFSAAPDHKESIAAISVSLGQISIAIGALAGGVAVDHYQLNGALLIGIALPLVIAAMMTHMTIREAKPAAQLQTIEASDEQ